MGNGNLNPSGSRTAAVIALVAAAWLTVACGHRASVGDPSAPRPVWPPPPDNARIEYLRTIRAPEDLGIRGSLLTRIFRRVVHGRTVREMARPYAVTVAPDGTIAVTDPDARSVHLFDVERSRYRRVTEAAGEMLVSPVGVAADDQNRFYVSDSVRGAVFRFDGNGRWIDVVGAVGELHRPTGLAFDRDRRVLWVVDTLGHRVVGYDEGGTRVATYGRRGAGDGEFNYPVAVAVDPAGRLFISDSMNFRVQVLEADGSFLRAFGRGGKGPGDLDKSKGVALDSDGHVYLVEGLHDVIQVFDAQGRLLTVIGGTGAGAGEFGLPAGIFIDRADRILVADSANHRIQVLRYLGDGMPAADGS